MSGFSKVSLLLVVILVSLAAYLRLAHSGIGCQDWPGCYGRLGDVPAVQLGLTDQSLGLQNPYSGQSSSANKSMPWATPAHRLVASALGLLIIAITILAFRARKHRLLSLTLLGLTVFLAVLGIKSGGLHNPAVVIGNLAGGFGLLGLLGWLVLGHAGVLAGRKTVLWRWGVAATLLLGAQIMLGGLTSANFAATACMTLPDCHGSYLPGPALARAFDISAQHHVDATGVVVGGPQQADIHKLHRLGGLITLVSVLVVGILALYAAPRLRFLGVAVIFLVVAEVSVGIAAIMTRLPIGLAVAHNWLAGLVLLNLLWILSLSRKGGYE
jgi:cytochrome c oxidase assembly protein subunit 15